MTIQRELHANQDRHLLSVEQLGRVLRKRSFPAHWRPRTEFGLGSDIVPIDLDHGKS